MGVASQLYITSILFLQLVAMLSVITRSANKGERNVNAVAIIFVAFALFLLWS